jgi:hypothetical protein
MSETVYNFTEIESQINSDSSDFILRHDVQYNIYLKKNMYFSSKLSTLLKKGDSEIFLKRLYLEKYFQDITIGAGRQKIMWGSSQFFNKSDIFNSYDITDLKKEKDGVDSVFFSKHNSAFSRTEFAYQFDHSDNKFAARYTWNVNSFEYMVNYLDYNDFGTGRERREIVFEFKGDLEFGFWGQFGFNLDDNIKNSSVIGVDYSWEIQQNILIMVYERFFEGNVNSEFLSLFYSIDEFSSIGANMLFSSNTGKVYGGFVYNYIIDDFRSIDALYSRYFDNIYFVSKDSWDLRLIYKISF